MAHFYDDSNDDEIDALLAALDSMPRQYTTPTRSETVWTFSRTEVKCLGCNRTYSGLMQHLADSPYLNSTILWCPNCIKENEEKWWLGCLRMEGVNEIV